MALVDVGAAVGREFEDALLLDLPRGLVLLTQVLGDGRDGLNGTLVAEDLVLHADAP